MTRVALVTFLALALSRPALGQERSDGGAEEVAAPQSEDREAPPMKGKAEPRREAWTEEGLYAEAKRLLAKALAAQGYPADRGAMIEYLRLSAVTHRPWTHRP